ncbi:hypothetical protein K2173_004271 [Erythroxylum novogranatense]|uniref:BRCT domain-containing protein n=1 Tax=Erythroxylum novogranatense TaxID=1862640 RepID=A0AAV8U2E1_9ROSI|nr:hypothetical protein K2173_004271 [Erythroxylum novogranatense]
MASGGGGRRNLPPSMSSPEGGRDKSTGKNLEDLSIIANNSSSTPHFSKLLEGVVIVLSGLVNPDRATIRSQALEMGAQYRPDWGSDCTLLVSAYSNTPKFRQVQALSGSIVHKDWIAECYRTKKLVEIDPYLMHAGKPWRDTPVSNARVVADQEASLLSKKSEKQVERISHSKKTSTKSGASDPAKVYFSPSKVKEWAVDDLNRTISWLESQDEKPNPSEIKQIAAEGIIICLQDAIDSLEQNQDVRKVAEQWNVIPHAVEELVKLVDGRNNPNLLQDDICRQARELKQMYESELRCSNDDSKYQIKKLKMDESENVRRKSAISTDAEGYDSDETIEMTEEEIDLAYNTVASSV